MLIVKVSSQKGKERKNEGREKQEENRNWRQPLKYKNDKKDRDREEKK